MIAIQMHANVVGIAAGCVDSFDSLSRLVNMMALATYQDPKFANESGLMERGMATLNEVGKLIEDGATPEDHHMKSIRALVSMFDCTLPRLDVMRLYRAEKIAGQPYQIQQAIINEMTRKRRNLCT